MKKAKQEIEAGAAREAEEAARKEREAAEEAELAAKRKAAEAARLSALGLKDQIKALDAQVKKGGLSKAEEYTIGKQLAKLRKEQGKID
jgi:hypothetical protein